MRNIKLNIAHNICSIPQMNLHIRLMKTSISHAMLSIFNSQTVYLDYEPEPVNITHLALLIIENTANDELGPSLI